MRKITVIIAVLAVVTVFAFAGCQKNQETPMTAPQSAVTSTVTSTATTTAPAAMPGMK